MLVKLTEDNLTDALFHGATLEPTEPFAGTRVEVRQQARVMLAGERLLAACEALLELVDAAPRRYQYDPELGAVVDEAREAVRRAREG